MIVEATPDKPCPFCGHKHITLIENDDDSWTKTLSASCDQCGCTVESSIDYKPYWSRDMNDEFDDAWVEKILAVWNTRAQSAT